MTPSGSIFTAVITVMMATMAMLALTAMPLAAAQVPDKAPDKRGIGWLYDYCDDDWSIMPPYYFVGKCDVTHPPDARAWLSIDLTGCYTVTDDGMLAVDNKRVRCTDLDKDVCMKCLCSRSDGSRVWSVKDLDDDLYVDVAHDRICCGEWWGGPYCGFRGQPDKPAVPGQAAYVPTLWP
ncbi:hypothetical protein PG994_000899 [Apiospora phragmitis]|uniref:Cyanovirin-N domain-containing protein n=1 Tax=Apiospora phragmitis TaxID=2905665 RepID=A0ABR1WS54_9PEZI